MLMDNLLIIAFILLIVLANALVSFAVVCSDAFEPRQKAFQLLLIWLVPVFGAAFLWAVLREERPFKFKKGYGTDVDDDLGYLPLRQHRDSDFDD